MGLSSLFLFSFYVVQAHMHYMVTSQRWESRYKPDYEYTFRCVLIPYYTMCFSYVALAIKPSTNEMYLQRK